MAPRVDNLELTDISWVTESKFARNQPRADVLRRDRLMAQLDRAADKRLVLIVAPAGYGKSSLLGQWAQEFDHPNGAISWLTLESEEVDPKRFLSFVVLVLERAGVDLQDLVTGARALFCDAAVEVILARLINALNANTQKIILVLEDYHCAECPAVNDLVKRLMRNVVSDFTLFIDSRHNPQIDVSTLIASGDALEIDANQLTLSRNETFAVLADVADADACDTIYAQTEGWPVAVQLARVQKQTQPAQPIVAGAKAGLIASYLTEQVLAGLDDDVQSFLLSVAFLDRFNATLACFVMQQDDAWKNIDALASFSALIVPLDRDGQWFRLHHLFAEYLRELQTKRNAARARTILQRASQWYEQHDDILRAVRFAATAEDYAACERVVRQAGGWRIILNQGIGELRGALRPIPPHIIAGSAVLLLSKAYLACKDGEVVEARALLDQAILKIEENGDLDIEDHRVSVEAMVNLYEDKSEASRSFDETLGRLLHIEKLDALELGTLRCREYLLHASRANFEDAQAAIDQAFASMRQSGSALGLNYCYIHAAHLAFHRGDLERASVNIDRALAMAEENFGSDSGLKNIALILDYTVKAWRGTASASDVEGFENAIFHAIDYDGWVEIYITAVEGALLLSRQIGDDGFANRVLERVLSFATSRNLSRLGRYAATCAQTSFSTSQVKWADEAQGLFEALVAAGESKRAYLRDWQSVLRLCERDGAQSKPGAIDQAIAFAQALNVPLAQFRLQLTKVLQSNSRAAHPNSALLELLDVARLHSIAGPFLADDRALNLLRALRKSAHLQPGEPRTLAFVDHILDTANALQPKRGGDVFSQREAEVFQALSQGQTNKEIARSLNLNENTVKFHLKNIFSKLNVNKRTQAIVRAQERGLL